MHLVERVHAILLSGGSAFGLTAAGGVMRYLEERDIGFETPYGKVPIVPAAVIFDLGIGSSRARPTMEMAYQACLTASDAPVRQGNVGAGIGATVGKVFGMSWAIKAGQGSAAMHLGDVVIGALVVVNAFGDVISPQNGEILAGARIPFDGNLTTLYQRAPAFANTLAVMKSGVAGKRPAPLGGGQNTIIGVIATNAALNREQAAKIAQMAHDGLARVIQPAHTMFDGDTLFVLGTGTLACDVTTLGACAAEVTAQSVLRAVYEAQTLAGIPAIRDIEMNTR